MSFNTPNGTHGASQPKATGFLGWMNARAISRIRRKSGKFMGMNALVLNTIGKKSGAERAAPLGWFAGEDGSWLVVAAAAGGARNPAWSYNIAGNPDQVTIDIDGRRVPVTPAQLHGESRERAWKSITTTVPRFSQYEAKTDRELPIIRLSPK